MPRKLSDFFITVAQIASRPWGGFNVENVRKQYRYSFHNNRIPDDSNGSDETEGHDDDEDVEDEEGNQAQDE